MFYSNKNDMMRVKHYDPQSIEFSLFTNEDIKKLSVTKISTPLTFDALGYPLPAGLYDRCMGECIISIALLSLIFVFQDLSMPIVSLVVLVIKILIIVPVTLGTSNYRCPS